MTDTQIIAAIKSGTHVLVPATGQWLITTRYSDADLTLPQSKADHVSILEMHIDCPDEARDLAAALWLAEASRGGEA
jgi:hypothetical protein